MTCGKFFQHFAVSILILLLAACETGGHQVDQVVNTPNYWEYDIDTLQALMQKGDLSSQQLTRYYLDRIDAIDRNGPALNSIINQPASDRDRCCTGCGKKGIRTPWTDAWYSRCIEGKY